MNIDPNSVAIGQWTTYFDTGIWTMKDGYLISPKDPTIEQLKDFLLASVGWIPFHHYDTFVEDDETGNDGF